MIKFWIEQKNRNWLRLTGGVISLSLLFSIISAPFAQANIWEDRRKHLQEKAEKEEKMQHAFQSEPERKINGQATLTSISSLGIEIPEELGTIVKSYEGKDDITAKLQGKSLPTLIHIQDAHGIYAAQKNAASILKLLASSEKQVASSEKENYSPLATSYSLPLLVCVEGAWGRVSPEWLSVFPDEKIKKELAESLLQRAEITGEEYLGILQPVGKMKIYGIEEKEVYKSNRETRKLLDPERNTVLIRLSNIEARLQRLKRILYSKQLLELEAISEQFENQKVTLRDYFNYLKKLSPNSWDSAKFPTLSILFDLFKQEQQLSAKMVEEERNNLMDRLSRALDESTLTRLAQSSINFRLGKIKAQRYYQGLIKLAEVNNISVPQMQQYLNYLKKSIELDSSMVNSELKQLEREVFQAVIGKQQRVEEMVKTSFWMRMQKKFWQEKMSPQDWEEYMEAKSKEHRAKSERLEEIEKVLVQEEKQLNLYSSSYQISAFSSKLSYPQMLFLQESYYKLAFMRDKIMVENTLEKAQQTGKDRVVLIAGGFHTPGMIQILKDKGIPYVVIRPKLTLPGQSSLVSLPQGRFERSKQDEGFIKALVDVILGSSVRLTTHLMIEAGIDIKNSQFDAFYAATHLMIILEALESASENSDVKWISALEELRKKDSELASYIDSLIEKLREKQFKFLPSLKHGDKDYRIGAFTGNPERNELGQINFVMVMKDGETEDLVFAHENDQKLINSLLGIEFQGWSQEEIDRFNETWPNSGIKAEFKGNKISFKESTDGRPAPQPTPEQVTKTPTLPTPAHNPQQPNEKSGYQSTTSKGGGEKSEAGKAGGTGQESPELSAAGERKGGIIAGIEKFFIGERPSKKVKRIYRLFVAPIITEGSWADFLPTAAGFALSAYGLDFGAALVAMILSRVVISALFVFLHPQGARSDPVLIATFNGAVAVLLFAFLFSSPLVSLFTIYLFNAALHFGINLINILNPDVIRDNAIEWLRSSPTLDLEGLIKYLGHDDDYTRAVIMVAIEIKFSKAKKGTDFVMDYLAKNSQTNPEYKKLLDLYQQAKELGIEFPARLSTKNLEIVIQNRKLSGIKDDRPLAVVIYPKSDWNHAYYYTRDMMEKLIKQGYQVMYYEAGTVENVKNNLMEATKDKKATLFVIAGHGTKNSLKLSDTEILNRRNINILEDARGSLIKDGQIVLDSCCTGKGRERNKNNLANMLRKIFPDAKPKGIWAPTIASGPGKFIFDKVNNLTEIMYIDLRKDQAAIRYQASILDRVIKWLLKKVGLHENSWAYFLIYTTITVIPVPYGETWGLDIARSFFGVTSLFDPTGFSWTILGILVGIGALFSVIHLDLWDSSTYKEGKITLKEFLSRFAQRFIGGLVFTALLTAPGGFWLSLGLHALWNSLVIIGNLRGWSWLKNFHLFSIFGTNVNPSHFLNQLALDRVESALVKEIEQVLSELKGVNDKFLQQAYKTIFLFKDIESQAASLKKMKDQKDWVGVYEFLRYIYFGAEELEFKLGIEKNDPAIELIQRTVRPSLVLALSLLTRRALSNQTEERESRSFWFRDLGVILMRLGDNAGAANAFQQGIAIAESLYEDPSPNQLHLHGLDRVSLLADALAQADPKYVGIANVYNFIRSVQMLIDRNASQETLTDIESGIRERELLLASISGVPDELRAKIKEPLARLQAQLEQLQEQKRQIQAESEPTQTELKSRLGVQPVKEVVQWIVNSLDELFKKGKRESESYRLLLEQHERIEQIADQVRELKHSGFNAMTRGHHIEAFDFFEKALMLDPANPELKADLENVRERAFKQRETRERYDRTQMEAQWIVSEKSIPEILSKIAATVGQDDLMLHELLIKFLESAKSKTLSLNDLIDLNVYSRYATFWEVSRSREIFMTLDLRIRIRIAGEALAGLGLDEKTIKRVARVLIYRFNASPNELLKELKQLMSEETAKKVVKKLFEYKFEWEESEERIAFKTNMSLDKKKADPNSKILAVRKLLQQNEAFNSWFERQQLRYRLSLTEKLRIAKGYVEKLRGQGSEVTEQDEAEIKLAVAVIHFKDRFDIDLDVPLEEDVSNEMVPKDMNGNPLELIKKSELPKLFPHLELIDDALNRMPYTFTGANKEVRRFLVSKWGRAFYRSAKGYAYQESVDKSLISIDVPIRDRESSEREALLADIEVQMYLNTLYHEMGHGVGGEYMGVPFLYGIDLLNSWLLRQRDLNLDSGEMARLRWIATQMAKAEREEGLIKSDNMAKLFYKIILLVYKQRQKQYEQIRASVLVEVSGMSLSELQEKIGFEDRGTMVSAAPAQIVQDYLDGKGKHDQYDYIQEFLIKNPTVAEELRTQKEAESFLIALDWHLRGQLKSKMGKLADSLSFHNLAVDYIYRIPRHDRTAYTPSERPNANEFIAEYSRMFFNFHDIFKEEDKELHELFAIIYDAPSMSRDAWRSVSQSYAAETEDLPKVSDPKAVRDGEKIETGKAGGDIGSEAMTTNKGIVGARSLNIFQWVHEWLGKRLEGLKQNRDIKQRNLGARSAKSSIRAFFTILYNLTHPVRGAPITETLGLLVLVSLADLTGFSWSALALISAFFSAIHPNLWAPSTYADIAKKYKGWGLIWRVAARGVGIFAQRFVGGVILTAPIISLPLPLGLLTSGLAHFAWNLTIQELGIKRRWTVFRNLQLLSLFENEPISKSLEELKREFNELKAAVSILDIAHWLYFTRERLQDKNGEAYRFISQEFSAMEVATRKIAKMHEEANLFWNKKDYAAAQKVYHQIVNLDPKDRAAKKHLVEMTQEVEKERKLESIRKEAQSMVARHKPESIISKIESAIYDKNDLLVQELLLAFLRSEKLTNLRLDQVVALSVYTRYGVTHDIEKRRTIGKILDFQMRSIAVQKAAEPFALSETLWSIIQQILMRDYNAAPDRLLKDLRLYLDASNALKVVINLFSSQYLIEDLHEQIAFRTNQILEMQQGEAAKANLDARELLANAADFREWFENKDSVHRLRLEDKFKIVEKRFRKTRFLPFGELKTSPEELEQKLAVAVLHFKDRYDIDLDIPWKETTPQDQVPQSVSRGRAGELLSRSEIDGLLRHLMYIDQALDRIPYSFTGASKEIRRFVLTKSARAHYAPTQWESMEKSFILLFIPGGYIPKDGQEDIGVQRYTNILYHEMGHSVGGIYMGVPFLYNFQHLQEWIKKHGYSLSPKQTEKLANISALSRGKSFADRDEADVFLYEIVTQAFDRRRASYEAKRSEILRQLAKLSFEKLAEEIGWQEWLSITISNPKEIVRAYLEGKASGDNYGTVQDLLSMNPSLIAELSDNPKAKSFLSELAFFVERRIHLSLGGLGGDRQERDSRISGNPIALDYIYREPRQDYGDTVPRPNADEFMAEFTRMFFRFPSEFREKDKELYELFEIIYGDRRVDRQTFWGWSSSHQKKMEGGKKDPASMGSALTTESTYKAGRIFFGAIIGFINRLLKPFGSSFQPSQKSIDRTIELSFALFYEGPQIFNPVQYFRDHSEQTTAQKVGIGFMVATAVLFVPLTLALIVGLAPGLTLALSLSLPGGMGVSWVIRKVLIKFGLDLNRANTVSNAMTAVLFFPAWLMTIPAHFLYNLIAIIFGWARLTVSFVNQPIKPEPWSFSRTGPLVEESSTIVTVWFYSALTNLLKISGISGNVITNLAFINDRKNRNFERMTLKNRREMTNFFKAIFNFGDTVEIKIEKTHRIASGSGIPVLIKSLMQLNNPMIGFATTLDGQPLVSVNSPIVTYAIAGNGNLKEILAQSIVVANMSAPLRLWLFFRLGLTAGAHHLTLSGVYPLRTVSAALGTVRSSAENILMGTFRRGVELLNKLVNQDEKRENERVKIGLAAYQTIVTGISFITLVNEFRETLGIKLQSIYKNRPIETKGKGDIPFAIDLIGEEIARVTSTSIEINPWHLATVRETVQRWVAIIESMDEETKSRVRLPILLKNLAGHEEMSDQLFTSLALALGMPEKYLDKVIGFQEDIELEKLERYFKINSPAEVYAAPSRQKFWRRFDIGLFISLVNGLRVVFRGASAQLIGGLEARQNEEGEFEFIVEPERPLSIDPNSAEERIRMEELVNIQA